MTNSELDLTCFKSLRAFEEDNGGYKPQFIEKMIDDVRAEFNKAKKEGLITVIPKAEIDDLKIEKHLIGAEKELQFLEGEGCFLDPCGKKIRVFLSAKDIVETGEDIKRHLEYISWPIPEQRITEAVKHASRLSARGQWQHIRNPNNLFMSSQLKNTAGDICESFHAGGVQVSQGLRKKIEVSVRQAVTRSEKAFRALYVLSCEVDVR